METTSSTPLKGEGEVQQVTQTRTRKQCEMCNAVAEYKHTFLLEGTRGNSVSSAYCRDDYSWCEDKAIFTCSSCRPDVPVGYVQNSWFECGERFSHMFLEWTQQKIA